MRKTVAALAVTSILTGCTTGLPGLRPLSYQEPGETRVFVSYKACPHKAGENFAPILAAMAVEAASQLIKDFGTALSKGAEGGALPSSIATTNIEVSSDLPQCVVIIRGRFSPDADQKTEVALPPVPSGTNPLSLMRDGQPFETNFPKVFDLQHYIELQLAPSQNKTAITFAPALIYVARSMDGAKSGDRALSIAVKFSRPGHDDVGSVVLIGYRRIGDEDAYPLDGANRMLYEAPWFSAIDVPDAEATDGGPGSAANTVKHAAGAPPARPAGGVAEAAITAAGSAASADKAPGSTNGPFPYTLTTTVIETRPTKEFLAFVASVFTATEPTITEAVKGQIDPGTRLTAKTTSIDNASAYATAVSAAQTALLAYCALPRTAAKTDLVTKSTAALTAQLGAIKAALAADRTSPFPHLVEQGTSDPAAAAACAAYH